MKMYILIRDEVPDAFAPLVAAHASLACYKAFEEDADMQTWISGVFRKIICKVNDSEFAKAKAAGKFTELTESALDNMVVGAAFCPREDYPKAFKYLRMWRPG